DFPVPFPPKIITAGFLSSNSISTGHVAPRKTFKVSFLIRFSTSQLPCPRQRPLRHPSPVFRGKLARGGAFLLLFHPIFIDKLLCPQLSNDFFRHDPVRCVCHTTFHRMVNTVSVSTRCFSRASTSSISFSF